MRDKRSIGDKKYPRNQTQINMERGKENLEMQIQKAVGSTEWKKDIQDAINEGGERIVTVADHIGKYLGKDIAGSPPTKEGEKKKLTRTQIRNVFSAAKRAEMEKIDWDKKEEKTKFWGKFILFKPKIAYMTQKTGSNEGSRILGEILIHAVDKAHKGNNEKHFRNFMDLFEAILAYHVYHGGM